LIQLKGVGEHAGEVLAHHFRNLDRLAIATDEELSNLHEIGPIMSQAITQFFSHKSAKHVLKTLKKAGVAFDKVSEVANSSALSGKKCVVTGTLQKYSRNDIERLIKSLGGKVQSAVSSNTDYLIAGEKAGSKLKKAKTLGVTVLSEAEFSKLKDK